MQSTYLLRRAIALLLLAGATNVAIAQDLKAPLPKDPKVIKGKLPNGLTYYIRPNQKPEKKVELRLAVNAGSILEDDAQQGLAHFLEHMNFNGTKNFKKNELVSYLQSIGVEFGADLNAYTGFDETVYILPVPTDKAGNLDKGFQIIEDWAHNALLTDKDIDDERGVVLEESRLGKGAEQRMMDKYLPEVLSGSRYASRLPIGKDDILKTFKYGTIRDFYNDWYRPDLQAVAVVGDIDSATAMKYINKHFAGLKNPSKSKNRFIPEVPARQKPSAMVLTDKEATNYRLQIIFPAQKAEEDKTLGDYRESIKDRLAQQIINRRLSDLSRGSNPPFAFAATGMDSWARGYENFLAMAVFGADGVDKALNAVTAELARVKQYGFNQSELDLAKKNTMSQMEKAYNERNTTESGTYVDEYIRNFLTEEAMPGIENEYAYHQQMVPGIQLAELNSLVKEWLSSANTFSLITGPSSESVKLPTNAELVAKVQAGLQQQVSPLEERVVASSLMDKKPVAGKVVSKQEEAGLGATTYTLSNGIKVTIKPTDFKTDEILLKGVKKGGTNSYGVADKYNAQYASSVASAMGVGNFTPTDLEKVVAGKNMRVSASLGEISNSVSGNSTVKDLETMLQLLHLRLTQPRVDKPLFDAFKQKQKAQLLFLSSNPQYAFMDTTYSVLFKNNPLANSPVPKPEHFEAINLERAMSIYQDELGTADGYHFFLAGNVDPQTALPLIETYIGSIPAAKKTVAFKDNGVRPISGTHTIKYKKGSEPQSMILALYTGEVPYTEDFHLKAQAVSEILNIKVVEELREKLGGIYGGGFDASIEKEPYANYTMALYLPCGPENVDKLLAAAKEEINTLKTKGPQAKDLDKVKSQWHEKHRTKMQENGYWLGQMEQILVWGKNKQNTLEYDKWIDKLTTSDIQQTAKTLFNGKNEFVSILYPEKS
ncbi:MAG: insulinase family protein [Sphingobacteriales bacterium]|nr:MAG: insulinase family protein [Sphingobacteriales bacterium]